MRANKRDERCDEYEINSAELAAFLTILYNTMGIAERLLLVNKSRKKKKGKYLDTLLRSGEIARSRERLQQTKIKISESAFGHVSIRGHTKRMSQRENRAANSHDDQKDVNFSVYALLRIALNVRDDVRRDNIYYTERTPSVCVTVRTWHVIVGRRRGTSSACRSMTYVCVYTYKTVHSLRIAQLTGGSLKTG